jgi:tRNA dimethylallyltransferase
MKKILVICGPTATGKTDCGIKLAKKFDGELISADSRQVYIGMDIGTGKFSFGDKFKKFKGKWFLNDVWIHGYDLVEPDEQFSVADFVDFFQKTATKIWQKGKLPILVGGTGFYIKAVLDGIGTLGVPQDLRLRKRLENLGLEELQEKLRNFDPKKWKMMNESDRKNPRRLIRAIEIALSSQQPETRDQRIKTLDAGGGRLDALLIGLSAPRNFLYQRTDHWVEERLKGGLIKETKNLIKKDYKDATCMQGIIYGSTIDFLDGKLTKLELDEKLKGEMHDYIRRQLTWFKKDKRIIWFDIRERNWQDRLEKLIQTWLNKRS